MRFTRALIVFVPFYTITAATKSMFVTPPSTNHGQCWPLLERFWGASSETAAISEFESLREAMIDAIGKVDRRDILVKLPTIEGKNYKQETIVKKVQALKENMQASKAFFPTTTEGLHFRVVIVGAGPVGLMTAIQIILQAPKSLTHNVQVVVLEKRETFSRHNILKVFPIIATLINAFDVPISGDLLAIGCNELQLQLLKYALLLGIEVHLGTAFEKVTPNSAYPAPSTSPWLIHATQGDTFPTTFAADVLIGADSGASRVFAAAQFTKVKKSVTTGTKPLIALAATFGPKPKDSTSKTKTNCAFAPTGNKAELEAFVRATGINTDTCLSLCNKDCIYSITTLTTQTVKDNHMLNLEIKDPVTKRLILNRDTVNLVNTQTVADTIATQLYGYADSDLEPLSVQLFDFTDRFAATEPMRFIRSSLVQQEGDVAPPLMVLLVGDALLQPVWTLGTGISHGFIGAIDTAYMLSGFFQHGYNNDLSSLQAFRRASFRRMKATKEKLGDEKVKSMTDVSQKLLRAVSVKNDEKSTLGWTELVDNYSFNFIATDASNNLLNEMDVDTHQLQKQDMRIVNDAQALTVQQSNINIGAMSDRMDSGIFIKQSQDQDTSAVGLANVVNHQAMMMNAAAASTVRASNFKKKQKKLKLVEIKIGWAKEKLKKEKDLILAKIEKMDQEARKWEQPSSPSKRK